MEDGCALMYVVINLWISKMDGISWVAELLLASWGLEFVTAKH